MVGVGEGGLAEITQTVPMLKTKRIGQLIHDRWMSCLVFDVNDRA
jgi:hypothetical protein